MAKIGFAITSSFCTVNEVLVQMDKLVKMGHEVIPIVSPAIIKSDTRFGKGKDFKAAIEKITNKEIYHDLIECERFGPKEPLDILVIAPATGNFIAKLANGITDNPVNMVAKATLRNDKPIVIGIATNDGLGLNGQNIMKLINSKNIYFIPFGQDNYEKKINSLVAHYELLIPTIEKALETKQIQPILKDYQPKEKTLIKK